MKKTCIVIQKPSGYISPKQVSGKIHDVLIGTGAQAAGGGMIGFYISLMIAGILVMNVVWPTFDQIINNPGADKSYSNLSSTAKTIVGLFGLTLMLGLLIMILRPVM